MSKPLSCLPVLEYDYLRRTTQTGSADDNRIPSADFDALKALLVEEPSDDHDSAQEVDSQRLFRLCNLRGEEALQVRNFVGVIEAPSGLQIEVLPKIGGAPDKARETLLRMLRATSGIPAQPAYAASLRPVRLPLFEIFIREFLEATNHLIKRGLVGGYRRRISNGRFLKGRLLLSSHLRHNAIRADRFYVEHDTFEVDRPENRVIRSAVEAVTRLTHDVPNQRLCRDLVFALEDVDPSRDVRTDLELCVRDRSLSHYSTALTWAKLILLRLTPLGSGGEARVRALLFPMERLFEKYVGIGLRRHFGPPFKVRDQVESKSLVSHKGHGYFLLRPDFLVEQSGASRYVLDAKWKLIDESRSGKGEKYGMSQTDLYQLYAYGHKYLDGQAGERILCLIYPMTENFKSPLASFDYDLGHRLLVLPFDLDRCQVIGAHTLQ